MKIMKGMKKGLFALVPKLQLGNPTLEAPASSPFQLRHIQ